MKKWNHVVWEGYLYWVCRQNSLLSGLLFLQELEYA
jgi:hypothetical protein